jgi:glycosidase
MYHTSDQHPWFQRAREAPEGSEWRNFYVWSDTDENLRVVEVEVGLVRVEPVPVIRLGDRIPGPVRRLVINHTSDQHPWFQRAREAPEGSEWRNFYVWSDTDECASVTKRRNSRIVP